MGKVGVFRLGSLALLGMITLAGCGGGGGSGGSSNADSGSTTAAPANYQGQFVDSPVSGLNWKTATRSGVTDANGYFGYDTPGEAVTFTIGSTELSSTSADQLVHVFDLGLSPLDALNEKGNRIAQLLQTLDADRNPANGIQLTPEVKAQFAKATAINFNAGQTVWDGQIADVSAKVANPVVAMNVAYAHAASQQATSANCVVPVKTYKLNGVSFSSKDLNCIQRAKLEAFYFHANPGIQSAVSEAMNFLVAHNNESAIDDFAKKTIQKKLHQSGNIHSGRCGRFSPFKVG